METKLLATFVEVCRSDNIAQAATQLGITQPAVSKRLAILERDLKSKLFQRIGLKLSLTSSGENFLPMAEEILLLIRNRKNDLLNMNSRIVGELHIACSHHIALYRLPEILKSFYQQYRDIHFQFTFTESETAYQMVQSGSVDIAFLTLPANISSHIMSHTLWRDEMKVMVAKSHQIFENHPQITLSELLDYPAVLPEKATFTMRRIETAFRDVSIRTLNGLNANNMETIRMLIETGLGWGVLPMKMYRDTLNILETPEISLNRILGMAYHSKKSLNMPALTFIEYVNTNIYP